MTEEVLMLRCKEQILKTDHLMLGIYKHTSNDVDDEMYDILSCLYIQIRVHVKSKVADSVSEVVERREGV